MLDRFPGFLGYGGIIAIHANWPMYPPGKGWSIALRTLGNFPKGTNFYEIDDIDRCKLLINKNPEGLADPFDSKYYHAAIWHEDLIELNKRGLVDGVLGKSNYEFELYQFENFKKAFGDNLKLDEKGNIIIYSKDETGQLKETKLKKPEYDDEDEELSFRDCVVIDKVISLTNKGLGELTKLANEINFTGELFDLVQPLIKIDRFDTAIRDASLLIETKIKKFHNAPNLYGQKLVDFHIEEVIKNNGGFNSAAIKCYRGELRTIFKFIRNDFAHNFKILTEEQCKVILSRINGTLDEFNEVKSAYFSNNKI